MTFFQRLTGEGRLPFFLLFVSFLLTFLLTRLITRLIRAGRGPFRNQVSGGVHIHHAVPGILLTVVGSFLSVGAAGDHPWADVAAVLIGLGTSLVLDEFALILHLKDVYWGTQGQLSVQLVFLTLAVLGLSLIGFDPLTGGTGLEPGHLVLLAVLPVHLAALWGCLRKGKYPTAVIGAFVAPVAWLGALRLARPGSSWANRRYRGRKAQRAQDRADGFDRRFGAAALSLADLVAGRPTGRTPPGPAAAASSAGPAVSVSSAAPVAPATAPPAAPPG